MKHILLCTALILPLVMMMTGCDLPIGATSQIAADPHAGHAHAETSASAPASDSAERDPNRLWCGEHDVYEDECVLCHPELDEHAGHDHGHVEGPDGVMWCGEHNVAEQECGICQPALLMEMMTGQGMKVRLPSGLSIDKAGIQTGRPASSSAEEGGRVLGEVTFNKNESVTITPLADGVLTEIHADVGDRVEAGQLLAMVRTPAVAEGKGAYVSALADLELARRVHAREKDLVAREIAARQDEETARATLAAAQGEASRARQVLLDLGLGEKEIDDLMNGQDTAQGLPIRAPFPGTVVEREAVLGASVSPGSPLFQIANLDQLWMTLSVPELRMASLRPGMPVRARFSAYPGLAFEGEVSWIAAQVDSRTRMVEARAVLANPQGLLKAGMFGEAELGGLEQRAGVAIPREAVQDVDGLKIVFARLEPDLYEARLVEPGVSENGMTAIRGGLEPSDEIVLAGSHILKSEFLKARLGAGCADH